MEMSGFVLENGKKEIGALNYDGFVESNVSRELFLYTKTEWIIFLINSRLFIVCWFCFVVLVNKCKVH